MLKLNKIVSQGLSKLFLNYKFFVQTNVFPLEIIPNFRLTSIGPHTAWGINLWKFESVYQNGAWKQIQLHFQIYSLR